MFFAQEGGGGNDTIPMSNARLASVICVWLVIVIASSNFIPRGTCRVCRTDYGKCYTTMC